MRSPFTQNSYSVPSVFAWERNGVTLFEVVANEQSAIEAGRKAIDSAICDQEC
jgi:hypothetical protein